MRYQDWRVSRHFVLSDFLCGLPVLNSKVRLPAHTAVSSEVMANARWLADSLLEPLLERWGPLSLGKGFVPEPLATSMLREGPYLSHFHEKFVDRFGAGVDTTWHHQRGVAPIDLCHEIDRDRSLTFHRLMSHGSQVTIVARHEAPSFAIHEAKAGGKSKFHGVGLQTRCIRTNAMKRPEPTTDWRGKAAFDSHRFRISPHFMLTDFAFDEALVAEGVAPPMPAVRMRASRWAEVLDPVKAALGHISVTHVSDNQAVFLLPQDSEGLPGIEHPAIVNIEQKDHPSETTAVRLTVGNFVPRCKFLGMDGTP